jgi:hypothetical protein
MLDNFAPEDPIIRVDKKPAELVGFESEVSTAAAQPVSTRAPRDWGTVASPPTLFWTGCTCAALTLGAVALPVGIAAPAPDAPDIPHVRVFVAMTPVKFSVVPRGNRARQTASALRTPARKTVLRAKVLTPPAKPSAVFRPPQKGTPAAAIQRDQPQPVQPAPSVTSLAATSVVTPPVLPSPVAAAAAVVRPVSLIEEAAVRYLLERYRSAYEQLDARAARRVWPSLDERRLARAFSSLESQALAFEECRVDVGAARGVAECRGRATYVGRIGSRSPQTEDRSWTFVLQKTANRWAIQSVRSE